MTKPTVTEPEAADQPSAILLALSEWLTASPGRRVTLEHTDEGWQSTLEEFRTTSGGTLVEAVAQSAQVAALELLETRAAQAPNE